MNAAKKSNETTYYLSSKSELFILHLTPAKRCIKRNNIKLKRKTDESPCILLQQTYVFSQKYKSVS